MTVLQANATNVQACIAIAIKGGVDEIVFNGDFPNKIAFYNAAPPKPVQLDFTNAKVTLAAVIDSGNWSFNCGQFGRGAPFIGIQCVGAHDLAFNNIDVSGYGSCGLGIVNCDRVTVQDSKFHDTAHDAIDISNSRTIRILRNEFLNLVYGPDHTDGVQFQNHAAPGIDPGSDDVAIWDNVFLGRAQGFGGYSDKPVVRGCSVLRNFIGTNMSQGCWFDGVVATPKVDQNGLITGVPNELDGNICFTIFDPAHVGWEPPDCKMSSLDPTCPVRIGTNVNGIKTT